MDKKKPVNEVRPASVSSKAALALLKNQRAAGQKILENRPISLAVEKSWETITSDALTQAFGESSPNVSSVMNIGTYGFFGTGNEKLWEEQRGKDMTERLVILDSLIELITSDIRAR